MHKHNNKKMMIFSRTLYKTQKKNYTLLKLQRINFHTLKNKLSWPSHLKVANLGLVCIYLV